VLGQPTVNLIRRLPNHLVNQIAAGEVVERPAAALKELIENALDAGARHIAVSLLGGGTERIGVADDGHGMSAPDIRLALERHATSKLPHDRLDTIATMGFRGEALPSIASVATLAIASRVDAGEGWRVAVDHGRTIEDGPAAAAVGTRVSVEGLFARVPARRKFLKTPRAEYAACLDVMRRLALARRDVAFSLDHDGRRVFDLPIAPTLAERFAALLGQAFADDSVPVDHTRDTLALTGLAGLPSFHRAAPEHQYLFVGGRPVRDRALLGAIKGAYTDVMDARRHAVVALFIEVPSAEVDVNVHPAKTEVRFADAAAVRALVVGGVRRALDTQAGRTTTGLSLATLQAFRYREPNTPRAAAIVREARLAFAPAPAHARADNSPMPVPAATQFPLGIARAQLHASWIVAETADGMVLVDQHAAHERIVLERLKAALGGSMPPSQALLLPAIVELDPAAAARVAEAAPDLARFGLEIEQFGPRAVVVRALPAPLAQADPAPLIRDIADELASIGAALAVGARLERVVATIACHGAVRAGRRMDLAEMDALLRAIEATPHAGTCNHGRPTFVRLGNNDIERLFERR